MWAAYTLWKGIGQRKDEIKIWTRERTIVNCLVKTCTKQQATAPRRAKSEKKLRLPGKRWRSFYKVPMDFRLVGLGYGHMKTRTHNRKSKMCVRTTWKLKKRKTNKKTFQQSKCHWKQAKNLKQTWKNLNFKSDIFKLIRHNIDNRFHQMELAVLYQCFCIS